MLRVAVQKRFLSIDSCKFALNEAAVLKKQDYYKNIAEQQVDNAKPAGWDEAKPFKSIPGPQPVPILGNTFRFFPKIGEFYGLDLVEFSEKLYRDYGDIVLMSDLGGKGKHFVSLYSPEYIEALFRNDGVWPSRMGLEAFDYYRNVHRKDIFQGVTGLVTRVDLNQLDHNTLLLWKIAIATAIDMLQAGADTTSKTVCAALYYLVKNPEVQKKLRKELIKLLPHKDSPVTKEVLKSAHYAKAIIKETMRLAPVVGGTARNVQKDLIIGGYQIPKGVT